MAGLQGPVCFLCLVVPHQLMRSWISLWVWVWVHCSVKIKNYLVHGKKILFIVMMRKKWNMREWFIIIPSFKRKGCIAFTKKNMLHIKIIQLSRTIAPVKPSGTSHTNLKNSNLVPLKEMVYLNFIYAAATSPTIYKISMYIRVLKIKEEFMYIFYNIKYRPRDVVVIFLPY